ncbi:MAG: histidinol-phosphate transaminase [Candidatus Latescibacter sp.]|nr:histidinol-phosphate transaminase [Candidatus Latescibacter sp.]
MKNDTVINRVKPEVRAISAYTLREYEYEIKINQNENPYDVPRTLKKEILDFALERSWSRYPPFVPEELKERLAAYAGWKPEGVLVGNGSNEIILALLTVFLAPGKKLVIPTPTFTLYRLIGAVVGADVISVPLNKDYTFDCEVLEERFLREGDMLVICSPNNPTGCLYPVSRITGILEKTSAPVVIDEAYFEFSGETAAGLLREYSNLIVLRTFSKAFSLAGLRVGYGLMNPELAREVGKAKLPYNINFLSIAAAMKLLNSYKQLEASVKDIIREREPLIQAMNQIEGVTAYPSRANFILFETPFAPKKIFEKLLAEGILIRDVSSYPMLEKALRVSVSTQSDNRRFLNSLTRIMNELKDER